MCIKSVMHPLSCPQIPTKISVFSLEMMDSNANGIVHEFQPFFRIYEDGRVERFRGTEIIPPPPNDPKTGLQSKDTVVSPQDNLSARLYLPQITNPTQKLPILVYVHGGAFCIESPFSPLYTNHLAALADKAKVVIVSIQYRRAPEHPLPIAYDDAWTSLKWVASHASGDGPDQWLNGFVDFERVFLGGDSAGANIAHNMCVTSGAHAIDGLRIIGLVLIHPFFGNNELDRLIDFIFPSQMRPNDPRINPAHGDGQELRSLGCTKVLVCAAGNDWLRERAVTYYDALKKSSWSGSLQYFETEAEEHVFHLFNPQSEKAEVLMEKIVSFINKD